MESTPDIFAGLDDFCANYNPDNIKYPGKSGSQEVIESSDSDNAEEFFTTRKGKSKNETQKARTAVKKQKSPTKSKPSSAEDLDEENNEIPPPTKAKGKSKSSANIVRTGRSTRAATQNSRSQYLDVLSELANEDHFGAVALAKKLKRTGRPEPSFGTDSIEAYMQRQTEAILALENTLLNGPRPSQNQSQKGKARRRCMADKANKATVTSVVDLAGPKTPPLPPRSDSKPIKSVISLDSDDEGDLSFSGTPMKANSSFDLENAELSVKVNWGENIDCVPHRQHQKFIDLLEHFAKEKAVDYRDIILRLNERVIQPDDTPYSVGYNIAQFIYGSIVPGSYAPAGKKKKDPNVINVKIQSDKFKKPLKVPIKKDERFKILYIKCAEELKISCDRIKLSFDGEPLILSETPLDLDLEGGELIDCKINPT